MTHRTLSDIKVGHYYVSIINGTKKCLALGPFTNNHRAALARVDEVRDYVEEHDPKGVWYAYGTCRYHGDDPRPGLLNQRIGI